MTAPVGFFLEDYNATLTDESGSVKKSHVCYDDIMSKFTEFLKEYPTKKFKRGSVILHQGDIPTAVHVIKTGFVKVYNITAAGDERQVLFDITYEVFPIGWIFNKIRHMYFYYEAFSDVELYLVPKDDYVDFLRTQPDQMWRALDYYVDRHIGYQLRMHALEQSKAREKILYTFEFLVRRFGKPSTGANIELDIPLTQQDFANFVGLTRETISLELNKLQREKVITYDKQTYVVDEKRLQKLLNKI